MSRAASHGERHAEAVERLFRGVDGPVADFGCGEGIFAGLPGWVGLDAAAASAAAARADVAHAPLRDASCAGVLCVNVLHLLRDPLRALEEMDRVLRPGGRAYVKNRWYKTAGRRRGAGSLLARGAHQASFWMHGVAHGGTPLFTRGNPDGTRAICPGCFRRFFRRRGYRVDFPETHVALLAKPGA